MLKKSALLIAFVLILDQILKIWIKTNMMIGQEIQFFDWFIIHFTENKGMAFGMEFGGNLGKYILSIFRLIAIVAIGIYWYKLANTPIKKGIVYSISLILAGAIGNMIDSAFYGMIFSESYGQLATVFEGGYSSFLQGKVVDMFYFPLINGHFPSWLPLVGGNHFIFFRPVFNIADAAISTGVINILIFHRSFFK
ncbi:MAG: lipoprotein signal peptidase [Flavobacteriales bacterium]|mgnify:CR=1 FL=1|jgi:signal peptidase II|nr:lipoprotein signal peptidase [Flavobacteriales bacterium]|tara:strand:+ start:4318 stop:4902 length:585 start_codon:yes stop_codon:yes gene_type:complete